VSGFLINLVLRGAGLPPQVPVQLPSRPEFIPAVEEERPGAEAEDGEAVRMLHSTAFQEVSLREEPPSTSRPAALARVPEPVPSRALNPPSLTTDPLLSLRVTNGASTGTEVAALEATESPPGSAQQSEQQRQKDPPLSLEATAELAEVLLNWQPAVRWPLTGPERSVNRVVTAPDEWESALHHSRTPPGLDPRADPRPEATVSDASELPGSEMTVLPTALAATEEAVPVRPQPRVAWEPPAPPAVSRSLDAAVAASDRPRVQVRIGRVEVQMTPPPVPAALRGPRGFAGHSLARRYLDRTW
jgi:hypothetical protein